MTPSLLARIRQQLTSGSQLDQENLEGLIEQILEDPQAAPLPQNRQTLEAVIDELKTRDLSTEEAITVSEYCLRSTARENVAPELLRDFMNSRIWKRALEEQGLEPPSGTSRRGRS